jgi:hypothetical protein
MKLRKRTNKPLRYREDDDEDSHSKPLFIYEPTPFNPNLRPACFPTLPLHLSYEASENSQPAIPIRPALVFRDPRVKRDKESNMEPSPNAGSGSGSASKVSRGAGQCQPATRRVSTIHLILDRHQC